MFENLFETSAKIPLSLREGIKKELTIKRLDASPEAVHPTLDKLVAQETLGGMWKAYREMAHLGEVRRLSAVVPLTYMAWMAETIGNKTIAFDVHSELVEISNGARNGRVSVLYRGTDCKDANGNPIEMPAELTAVLENAHALMREANPTQWQRREDAKGADKKTTGLPDM